MSLLTFFYVFFFDCVTRPDALLAINFDDRYSEKCASFTTTTPCLYYHDYALFILPWLRPVYITMATLCAYYHDNVLCILPWRYALCMLPWLRPVYINILPWQHSVHIIMTTFCAYYHDATLCACLPWLRPVYITMATLCAYYHDNVLCILPWRYALCMLPWLRPVHYSEQNCVTCTWTIVFLYRFYSNKNLFNQWCVLENTLSDHVVEFVQISFHYFSLSFVPTLSFSSEQTLSVRFMLNLHCS